MRFSKTGWAAVAALVMVAMVSQVALAQREQGQGRRGRGGPGGPGGGGMMSLGRLATLPEVQTALKVTDDQKDKIKKINDDTRDKMREAFDGSGGREKVQELMEKSSDDVTKVLDAGQQKRLMGILVQVSGPAAALEPAIGKELNLTADQKTKLQEARQSNMQAMRDAYSGGPDQNASREETRAKMDKMRDEANKKYLAVLTTDQQTQLESMKGEKVDIDMAQLRGGAGGRGAGGAGRRGRPADTKSDDKSSN